MLDVKPGDTVRIGGRRGDVHRLFHILSVSRPFSIFDFGGCVFGYWTDDTERDMISVPLRAIERGDKNGIPRAR